MIKSFVNFLLRLLFYPVPKLMVSKEEEKLFDNLFENACSSPEKIIKYNLPIPKYKFLHYILKNKSVVLHGSNNTFIHLFEPRDQTLFDGKRTKAVFASKDPIWSIFYAVFKRESLEGNFRNGCITVNNRQKYHFYSLTAQTFYNGPWMNGMIYLLPEKSFNHISKKIIKFDEWTCNDSVLPIARIAVAPNDFYFLHKVACHNANESIAKTWFLYKLRTVYKSKKSNEKQVS
jgi:hypothetical protein